MAHPLVELLFATPPRGGDDDAPGPRREPRPSATIRLFTDDQLVAGVRDGDVAAFRQLYLDTFRELWSFARRYVHSAAVAEELVQDVFLRIWERRATWEVRGSPRSYLFGAVRNHALHAAEHVAVERRASGVMARDRAGHSVSERTDPHTDAEHRELETTVARALDALPERQRAAMLLRLRHGLSHAQIGEALGIAPAVAGRLVVKGEQKLRESLSGVVGG